MSPHDLLSRRDAVRSRDLGRRVQTSVGKQEPAVYLPLRFLGGIPNCSWPSHARGVSHRFLAPPLPSLRRRRRRSVRCRAGAAGRRVHVDHTLLDVFVQVGPEPDGVPERLWLTVAICAWSRAIVGYDLSFDAPAVGGLFTTLRDLFDRHRRMPNRLVVDRGPEFGSVAFDQLCAACEIDKLERPSGRPKFGPVVEQMFGTVNTQLVHELSGNTQLTRNPRQMSRDVDPRRDAIWRLPELDDAVRRFLFDVYPRQPHNGLQGMTPHARFDQGLQTVGAGRPLPESSDIRFLLWPPSRRGTATVDPRTGIVVDCVRYWHADMRSERLRKKGLPQNLWVERRAGSPCQTHSVPVCSPPSRRVAPLRPRCAGLMAWTPAARTSVPALV